jgi:hypothetical protein
MNGPNQDLNKTELVRSRRRLCGTCDLGNTVVRRSTCSSLGVVESVVVVLARGLHELHRNVARQAAWDFLACNDRASDQDDEEDNHGEVEDRETDHSPSAELGLLQGINRGSDLTTTSHTLVLATNLR